MWNKLRFLLFLFSTLLLVSCSKTVDIQLEPEVNVYISNKIDKVIKLSNNAPEYIVITDWLEKHKANWYETSGRYSGGVYIKSGSHGIQITETHVVIYSTSAPEPVAKYIQNIAKGELKEILNLAK